jgi:hypothetical protein
MSWSMFSVFELLHAYIGKDFLRGYEGMRTSLKSLEIFGHDDESQRLGDDNNRRVSVSI